MLRLVSEEWWRDDGYARYSKRWVRYVPGLEIIGRQHALTSNAATA